MLFLADTWPVTWPLAFQPATLPLRPVSLPIARAHDARVQFPSETRPRRLAVRTIFLACLFASLFCASPLRAQQPKPILTATLIEPPSPELITLEESPSIEAPAPVRPVAAPGSDRLFWVMPNFLTVENHAQIPPLSVKMKFKLSEKTLTDPVTVSFLGALALIGQARNSNPTYGQELGGYAKRYATLFANTGISTVMSTSVFPTVLKQDPRYYQLGSGGAWRRVKYSVRQIFVTRSDTGKTQFNYSEILGNGAAAGISNTYLPQNQRTFGNTLNVWGTDLMLNALCNVAKEFWPDLRRKVHGR